VLVKAEQERAVILAEGKVLGARLIPLTRAEHARREAAHAIALPLMERREQAEQARQREQTEPSLKALRD